MIESADTFGCGPGRLLAGTEVHYQLEEDCHVHMVAPCAPAAQQHWDGVRRRLRMALAKPGGLVSGSRSSPSWVAGGLPLVVASAGGVLVAAAPG
jgi:hypothetical protein